VIRKYLTCESTPNVERLLAIAKAGNVDLVWLTTGEGQSGVAGQVAVRQVHGAEDSQLLDEFALIPGYKIQVSAGHGALNGEGEEPYRRLAFRRKWLKFRSFAEQDLVVVWAKGDSMEPTISNNDTLLIHTGRKQPRDGHIYVFRQEDTLWVKRVQVLPGGSLQMISDNDAYSPITVRPDEMHNFEVVGQVVNISKDVGD